MFLSTLGGYAVYLRNLCGTLRTLESVHVRKEYSTARKPRANSPPILKLAGVRNSSGNFAVPAECVLPGGLKLVI